jgi:hypothetical protein
VLGDDDRLPGVYRRSGLFVGIIAFLVPVVWRIANSSSRLRADSVAERSLEANRPAGTLSLIPGGGSRRILGDADRRIKGPAPANRIDDSRPPPPPFLPSPRDPFSVETFPSLTLSPLFSRVQPVM